MRIGFIGLGKLGMPCAEEMTRQHEVIGYDVEHRVSAHVKITQDIREVFNNTEIIFIAVPTPHHPDYDGSNPTTHLPVKDFDYSLVIDVLKQCQRYAHKNQIVSLISTVLPGTTRREFARYTRNFQFVYNPYLIAMGSEAYDMVHPDMVIIGTEYGEDTIASQTLSKFYKKLILNNAQQMTGTWEEAEGFKIFYNTMISARLSLVNMIQDVAQKIGHMNVDKITDAFKQASVRITGQGYYKAGMGDGGACHPRDNIALSWLAKELNLGYDLFGAIMSAREQQAENMAQEILRHGRVIYFTSNAYKPGTDLVDGSYSLLVQHYIQKHQGLIASQLDDSVQVIVRVHESDSFVDNGRCTVFDTWRTYPPADNVIYYGK